MRLFFWMLFPAFLFVSSLSAQPCTSGQSEVIIRIVPDNYPQETSWLLRTQAGDTLATGLANSDTLCVPNNTCLVFTIRDSYGDGICCTYGNGSYQVRVNGVLQASGGQFGFQETKFVGCSVTQACTNPQSISTGTFSAPVRNSWYSFKPDSVGTYILSTCSANANWDTKIWVYDNCNVPVLNNDNMGTVLYNDTNSFCGQRARIHAYFDTSVTYLIRIGGSTSINGPIPFSLTYAGPLVGCQDSTACNYDPLASVSGPCYFYPSPLCPPGPDLTVVQSAFENSLQRSVVNSSTCMVSEQCLTGHGARTVIRFDTDIRNIGQTDYFIGNPSTNPSQFNTNNCHNHAHYEGYAEYVLYPMPTNGTRIPIGFKNGFCVMDLACPPGFTAKYGCGNMGVTAGCGDIYGRSLDCQWIDITDVANGQYLLAIKVNWDQSPDALGRHETNYQNNWAQVCLNIYTDPQGQKQFTKLPNCAPYTDCAGNLYGSALRDCNGDCNGSALIGDLNSDTARTATDVNLLVNGLLQQNLAYSRCRDLSGDSLLNIWDAVLLGNCLLHGGTGSNCIFPRSLYNQMQRVDIQLQYLDTLQGYVDLAIRNGQNQITAFELELNGIRPTNVMSLIPGSPAMTFYYHPSGKIMGMMANLETSINRSSTLRSFVRVFFDRTTDTAVYIRKAIALTNETYESVLFVADSTRYPATANTTSVRSMSSKPSFLIYPNPGQGQFVLQGLAETKPVNLRIIDALGRQVMQLEQQDFSTGHLSLQLNDLKAGMYLVLLAGENGVGSQRLVIQ